MLLGKKKNSAPSLHTMSSLACSQSCAALQASPCTPQYDFTPYMLSQHLLLLSFPPVDSEPQKHLEKWNLWKFCGLWIFPLLSCSACWERRSKDVNKFLLYSEFWIRYFLWLCHCCLCMREANTSACSQVTWGNVLHEQCNAKPAEHWVLKGFDICEST